MSWDEIVSIVNKIISVKNTLPIHSADNVFEKRTCSYLGYTEMYSFAWNPMDSISYIDIYVDINSIRLECLTGHLFVINFNDYNIDCYTLTNGRPPQSIVISFNNIKEMFKDNKIELE